MLSYASLSGNIFVISLRFYGEDTQASSLRLLYNETGMPCMEYFKINMEKNQICFKTYKDFA